VKLPCLIFEDDHLLVVNKPAGINTHSPSRFAGEGLYDWLRNREPRWASLAIIHRLDKETSGLIVFSKSQIANRSLTEQFTARTVHKKYVLLTDRKVIQTKLTVRTALVRAGDIYVSRPAASGAPIAETRFTLLETPHTPSQASCTSIQAEPLTGRTHQIRVHAADQGFPILGDTRYGGTPGPRLCLHAAELSFQHPAYGEPLVFRAPPDFLADPSVTLRTSLIDLEANTAFRIAHGRSDGLERGYADVLGPYLLSQSTSTFSATDKIRLASLVHSLDVRGFYHKIIRSKPSMADPQSVAPRLELGNPAPDRFSVLENGLRFELSFTEGYSVGLFLDQRDNRRRILTGHVGAGFPLLQPPSLAGKREVLNAFAYTCGFSVCAAKAGARTTSVDLSKKYLQWGKRNFALNQLDPAEHDFLFGDVFDWLRRFHKKKRLFDLILLDPPTFSRSSEFGPFRVKKDLRRLIEAALPLLREEGVLFASSNAADWLPEDFLAEVRGPLTAARRSILREQYYPQPPDFPVSRDEPAYLKTVWIRVK